jgi:hypothetical protein
MTPLRRPKVFVGSSKEQLQLAYAIQANFEFLAIDVEVWTQGLCALSQSTMQGLQAAAQTADFAVFVFAPDDLATFRGNEVSVVRDNVIFELGLFAGRLGLERCFVVRPRLEKLHLPSDLAGITTATYDPARPQPRSALGPACNDIADAIGRYGPRLRLEGESFADSKSPSIGGDWLVFDGLSCVGEHSAKVHVDQYNSAVHMGLLRHRSRSGRTIEREFRYRGQIVAGQLTLFFDEPVMAGYITGCIVLRLSGNGRSLIGKTVYLDHDRGQVVAYDISLWRDSEVAAAAENREETQETDHGRHLKEVEEDLNDRQ